ncbi:hypothetical protein BJ138DRAFT_1117811 [Hygrophoropsis aurantiaca]|uniref:Uncharacterized protein n=1 Tax=Hygrophoropsis aurantiaca TaxID=72124 RepID=A0ACB7ZYI5_9AGAM|nr:hypothetical protein BJ138DRAFT_1117811 [Hygrophoropsis aurantiaca]
MDDSGSNFGTKVYRYKGVYFAANDIHPAGSSIGFEMLGLARSGDFRFIHSVLDGHLEVKIYTKGRHLGVAKTRPRMSTISTDYMCEVDYDRNVFHFQGQPFYRLDNLPSDREFRHGIAEDSFGNPCPRQKCPKKYLYSWKAAPPVIDLAPLRARIPDIAGVELPVHDILGVPMQLSDRESTRARLFEVVIAKYLSDGYIAALVREYESFAGPNQISDDTWRMAFSMVNFPFVLQIFPQRHNQHDKRMDFTWVRRDVVVHVTTHLDDAIALQAAVLRIVAVCVNDEEKEEKRPNVLFGVAFSVNHCAIVRVLKANNGAVSFQHTPALQFVPSFFATSPSTPGITALARLGNRPDPDLMQRALWWDCGRDTFWVVSPMTYRLPRGLNIPYDAFRLDDHRADTRVSTGQLQDHDPVSAVVRTTSSYKSAAERLPLEIWTQIASLVGDISSLINLGMVSRICEHAVCTVMQHPHIVIQGKDETHDLGLYRLTKATPHNEDKDLRYAEFGAVTEEAEFQIFTGLYGHQSDSYFVYPLYYPDDVSDEEIGKYEYRPGPRMTFLVTTPPPSPSPSASGSPSPSSASYTSSTS